MPPSTTRSRQRGSPPPQEKSKAPSSPEPTFHEVMEREGTPRSKAGRPRVPPPKRHDPVPFVRAAPSFHVEHSEDWVEGYRSDAPASLRARLRAAPAASLDLHGLTTAVARRRLVEFVSESYRASHELVLVIVGKGRHSPGGAPVLRDALASWLTSGATAGCVLGFRTAPPALGGAGGVLVLLSRPKR